jgi:alcohol dehydrogenase
MNRIFSFTGAKKIIFGCGSFERLPELVRELGGGKPLVIIDQAVSTRGMKDRVSSVLKASGIRFSIFDRVSGEPELELGDEAAKFAQKNKNDVVVGIGGGSAMDTAKAVSVLASGKVRAVECLGLNKVPKAGLPKIMIPTTAGTGSEVTFTAVFLRKDLMKKEGMNSPFLFPEIALLDPELTLGLPPEITATTGMDALCHAIESYTSVQANPMSELFSLEAIRLIADNLRICVHSGADLQARENMLLGSLYAGLGLVNAGVGAAHSLSYPLGGKYGISHGLANTLMLPPIMEFNLPSALEKFAMIAEMMGEVTEGLSVRDAAGLAVEAVELLIEDCGINTCLSALGVSEEDLPTLARIAMTVQRPLENNPRKVSTEEAIGIYKEIL